MITKWIGNLNVAFIGASVDDPRYDNLPPNWEERLYQRIYYDPDPSTGVDRSLRTYISTISLGKAYFDARVFGPVTVSPCNTGEAINGVPTSHLYDVACVVFPGGTHHCGGMAVLRGDPFPYFDPPRSSNRLLGWCRFRIEDSLGIWAMEFLHAATGFDDLYKTESHPGTFDEMACSCGTHPSSFTKWKLGWLDDSAIETVGWTELPFGLHFPTLGHYYALYALSLPQPVPPGYVTAVRIPTSNAKHYFLVEARLRTDQYERETTNVSNGIPGEGVVIYEVNEAVWAPMKLRTEPTLSVGASYSNPAARITVYVETTLPGGFVVIIVSHEMLQQEIQDKEQDIAALQRQIVLHGDSGLIRDMISEKQDDIRLLKEQVVANGWDGL